MSDTQIKISADLESNLDNYKTAGQIIFTEKTINIVKTDGTKVNYLKDKVEIVRVLPTIDIISNKPYFLTTDRSINIWSGTSWDKYGTSEIKLSGDLGGTKDNPEVTGINGIPVDDSTRSGNLPILGYNPSTKKHEYFTVSTGNIVNSSGDIVQPDGSPISISQGQEIIVNHNEVKNNRMMMQILEEIPGSTVSDSSNNFSNSNDYIQENSTVITIGNNVAELKVGKSCTNNYKMNETSGTACIDSKNLYKGTYNGTTSVTDSYGTYRSFNGTSDYINFNDAVIPNGKKSIYFEIKFSGTRSTDQYLMSNHNAAGKPSGFMIVIGSNTGNLTFAYENNNWDSNHSISLENVNDGKWHKILFTDDGSINSTSLKVYLDDFSEAIKVAPGNIIENAPSANLSIGKMSGILLDYFQGSLKNLQIYNDVINPSILDNYILTKFTSISLSTVSKINSISSNVATPANTSIKWLVSFDGRKKWLYHDGNGWHIAVDTGAGGNLSDSSAFTNGNLYSDIEAYFTNLTIAQLTADLSGLSVNPVQLDFAWLLSTTDVTITPSMGETIIDYTENSHYEQALQGTFRDKIVSYGVKRISSTTTGIKKISEGTTNIIPNIIIGN
ncbi:MULTISPECIES: LamG-like jellyroll fold domain-containing protein [Clostridium]|uniref:LamG-like jellyroll fold domain-containing protein n=1 Tax=Clostridium TaxID=1485 RepID=UPI0008254391|nr:MULTISPECIES: LamG-like jellyroll fold domain-containing protein [Clostridium]PJI07029.1 hypothetical protein CUB90_03750 [Clostridium sp. CT7]